MTTYETLTVMILFGTFIIGINSSARQLVKQVSRTKILQNKHYAPFTVSSPYNSRFFEDINAFLNVFLYNGMLYEVEVIFPELGFKKLIPFLVYF